MKKNDWKTSGSRVLNPPPGNVAISFVSTLFLSPYFFVSNIQYWLDLMFVKLSTTMYIYIRVRTSKKISNARTCHSLSPQNFRSFLVRWSPQRTLVPSFFYLSFFFLAFFILGLFTCNFMWFIKFKQWAGMCWGVHGCVRVGAGLPRCARLCVMNFQNTYWRLES